MTSVPSSTGIGAPGTAAAPANLSRSPMASAPNAPASAIPFTRAATLATMRDATRSYIAGQQDQVQLQTNAFLENVIMDVSLVTAANAATVAFAVDSPWQIIQSIKLDDPAGQSIIAPITGYQLYVLNKYLPDVECAFDPKHDPNYFATTGAGATGGSFGFRLVLPIEHRRRDALGALNNSAANQRYLITINILTSFATLYSTPPTTPAPTLNVQFYQQYWTSPPATITTAQGSSQTQSTPTGLGTVGFIRYERHNEVAGGGSPQIQFNNVGDYISFISFTLRDTSMCHRNRPRMRTSPPSSTFGSMISSSGPIPSMARVGPRRPPASAASPTATLPVSIITGRPSRPPAVSTTACCRSFRCTSCSTSRPITAQRTNTSRRTPPPNCRFAAVRGGLAPPTSRCSPAWCDRSPAPPCSHKERRT
jgi:hypothetical protein